MAVTVDSKRIEYNALKNNQFKINMCNMWLSIRLLINCIEVDETDEWYIFQFLFWIVEIWEFFLSENPWNLILRWKSCANIKTLYIFNYMSPNSMLFFSHDRTVKNNDDVTEIFDYRCKNVLSIQMDYTTWEIDLLNIGYSRTS